jgi:hypothetical protein
MYVNPQTGTWSGLGKTERTAALSAVEIKENYPQSASGVYWIHPAKWLEGPQQVYCDMDTDNGGWMMVGYAGNLSSSDGNWPGRKSTTARERTYWLPLFCNWNEIDSTSRTTNNSFSRPDFARAVGEAGDKSEFMAYRTNNQNNVVIWSAEDLTRFGTRNSANWTFPGDPGLIINKFLASTTAVTGSRTISDRNYNRNLYYTGYLRSRYESGPDYPGIAWNSTFNRNNDGDGSFETFLNRRSILYWETQNNSGSYTDNQWFHASPLELNSSSSPANGESRLDIGFYFREKKPNVRRIRVFPGMSQDYPAQNALEVLRYWPTAPSGLYWIKPSGYSGAAQQIFCEMEEDGGGWMMVASNNARDTTIPGGTGRNSSAYQLNRNGTNGALVGSFGITPEGDYIIGNMITTLAYGYVRVVGWGRGDLSGQFTYFGRSSSSSSINANNRGTWVKALWSVNFNDGAARETQIVPISNVGVVGSLSSLAAYFVLDGVKRDGEVSGFGANADQSTIGGAGVANANGDPQSGCYLGHGNGEGSFEGWYDASNVPASSQGYTTWVK